MLTLLATLLLFNFVGGEELDIVNGFPIRIENVPYIAWIQNWRIDCGIVSGVATRGALISEQHVITVVQSIGLTEWDIGLGCVKWNKCASRLTSRFSLIHPDYSSITESNDLRIIYLPYPVKFTPKIQPIMLPPFGEFKPKTGDFGLVAAVSTGKPIENVLYGTYQQVMSNKICKLFYKDAQFPYSFCAVDLIYGGATCLGEEGTPFVSSRRGYKTLLGILSKVELCMPRSHPAMYVKISEYRKWIHVMTGA